MVSSRVSHNHQFQEEAQAQTATPREQPVPAGKWEQPTRPIERKVLRRRQTQSSLPETESTLQCFSKKKVSTTGNEGSAFTVSSAFATHRPRHLLRDDLDMKEQFAEAKQRSRIAVHEANCEDFRGTCASRKLHEEFLALLLAEAERYHFGAGTKDKDLSESARCRRRKLRRHLAHLATVTSDMMEASENKYSKALFLVSSHHLFNDLDEIEC